MKTKPFLSQAAPVGLLALSLVALSIPVGAQGLFDPLSDGSDGALSFSAPPLTRQLGVIAYDASRNETVVFGGDAGGGFLSSTVVFDGAGWASLNPISRPAPRNGFGAAYDSARSRSVIFGGFSGGVPGSRFSDTWEFDGSNWAKVNVATSPSGRNAFMMAFDSTRDRVVMFGGFDTGVSNETWEYDGITWTLMAPTVSPLGRTSASMAFDAVRGKMVLFGGDGRQDTWEYDGVTWTEIVPLTSPPGRSAHQLVYDAERAAIVMFGGLSGGTPLNDTWQFDGLAWAQQSPVDLPPARSGHMMAYDSDRKVTVLHGGNTGSSLLNDTWEYTGTNWVDRIDISANPVLDARGSADGDSVFHYTTIDIPAGVTVTFRNGTPNTSPVWLADGNVNIAGTVLLNGEDGADALVPGVAARGGPGGFPGGLGGTRDNVGGPIEGHPGAGPGGGDPGITLSADGGDAGYAVAGAGNTTGGIIYGNALLNPLVAGSGGAGGAGGTADNGGKGGGAGGAILIASKEKIIITGSIHANQGAGEAVVDAGDGGDGSGGAIRLVANTIEGSGTVTANPNGRLRMEAFFQNYAGSASPLPVQAPPYPLDLATQGRLSIVSVAGVTVVNPGGNVNSPDVVFSAASPTTITVVVETDHIPVPSTVTLRVTAQGAALPLEAGNTAAAGGVKGTVSFTLAVPAGTGTIQAYADYVVP